MSDLRVLTAWDPIGSAGVTEGWRFTVTSGGTPYEPDALSIWLGGTLDDGDDLADATEYTATILDNVATVAIPVPTGEAVACRLSFEGVVKTVGYLTPSTTGTTTPGQDVALTLGTVEIALEVGPTFELTGGGGGGGQVDELVAGNGITINATDPTAPVVIADVDQADLDALSDALDTEEARATAAEGALDGRLDTAEATLAAVPGTYAPIAEPVAAAHIADPTDAHAASAITNTPAGNIAATTVQGAINELDSEKETPAGAQAKADAKVTQNITNGVTTTAPSEDAVFDALALKVNTSALDTDGTLAANSDAKVPTQKAVKTYADQLIASADAMVFKGVIDASGNPNYPAADKGHTYRISVAGKIGGASGVNVEVGDLILALADGLSAGTQAAVGTSWSIAQTNIDGGVVGPASATDGAIALFDGATGKLLKNSTAAAVRTLLNVEDGATADQTAAEILAKLLTVDGAGSGLDADTLDGANVGTSSGDIALLSTGGRFAIARLASGTPDGTKFVRDDGVLATPSGGSSGPTRHVFKTGKYYTYPDGTSNDTGMIRTITYLMPFFLDVAATFDRIGLVVNGSVASCNIHLGIYAAGSDGYPGALTLNAGTIDASSTGVKEITISQALSVGTYYLAALAVGGASNPTVRGVAIFAAPGVGMGAQPGTTSGGGWWHSDGALSALPNPYPTTGVQEISPVPRIGLRAA